MSVLVDLGYACGALAYSPALLYQVAVQKKHRGAWGQRFGGVDARAGDAPCIWIHAVSVGEVNATRQLVAQLREAGTPLDVVVSTTTDTGYARACQLYGEHSVFRYPLDFSLVVRRVLERIRPAMIVLMELEVWYNLLALAGRAGIPVVVANGRLTEHSARRFGFIAPLARRMFSRLTWVCAQDQIFAARFRRMGVPVEQVEITGSLKWDTAAVTDAVDGAGAVAAAMGIARDRPLLVCGSTGPTEEASLLDAYATIREQYPDLQLAIVPRKPERFDEVAELIDRRGYTCVRRSAHPDGATPAPLPLDRDAVFLCDTMGELRKLYSLASVVFIGRTLIPRGGSDMMEVAALGKPVVCGPHTWNFPVAAQKLIDGGGMLTAPDAGMVAGVVESLLADADYCRRVGAAARQVVLDNQGSTDRTVTRLLDILSRTQPQAAAGPR